MKTCVQKPSGCRNSVYTIGIQIVHFIRHFSDPFSISCSHVCVGRGGRERGTEKVYDLTCAELGLVYFHVTIDHFQIGTNIDVHIVAALESSQMQKTLFWHVIYMCVVYP